jgi:glucose/arabinose dehydrogenase
MAWYKSKDDTDVSLIIIILFYINKGWRYTRVGPDNRLYMSIGSPCNTPDDPLGGTCDCLVGRTCSYPNITSKAFIGSIMYVVLLCFQLILLFYAQCKPDSSGNLPNFDDLRVEAHGIRNSVGFDWHPITKELFFTDNGRDNMKPDTNSMPPDELNRVSKSASNKNFGFPYCYGKENCLFNDSSTS